MAGYDNVPDYEIKRQIVEVAQMMNRKGLLVLTRATFP